MSSHMYDINLGDGHYLKFVSWHPDDLLANREWLGIPDGPLPFVEKFAAEIQHGDPLEFCVGMVTFDGEWARRLHQLSCDRARREGKPEPKDPTWQVLSWEPLTLHPSILCHRCGDHGYVRDGKWVRA